MSKKGQSTLYLGLYISAVPSIYKSIEGSLERPGQAQAVGAIIQHVMGHTSRPTGAAEPQISPPETCWVNGGSASKRSFPPLDAM